MKEKRGVLLTILTSALLLGACGNQDALPASVAELETVPIKQESDGENGTLPEGGAETGEEDSAAGTAPEGAGKDSAAQLPEENNGESNALNEAIADRENGAPNGISGDSGGNHSAGTTSDGNGQALPAGGQAESGHSETASDLAGDGTLPGEESEEVKITISAAGDVTLGNYIGQGYEISFRQTYDKGAGDSYFFENVVIPFI